MPDDGILDVMRSIVGDDGVAPGAEVQDYAYDALRGNRAGCAEEAAEPFAVVRPTATGQVAAIVRYACAHQIAIVPYGGGTGLMGGARSTRRSIVVDLTRMDRVREIDELSQVAWIEAGARLVQANERLAVHGLMLGHDPWTYEIATIGGAISTNGLGFLGGKYGSMGEQVLGVEAVLPDGSVITTRPVRPKSTGIDLTSLFVGGEGQFGIVTAAALRAFPIPEERRLLGFRFHSFERGFGAILEMHRAGLKPTVLDFGERPQEGAAAPLYVGFDGVREIVSAEANVTTKICRQSGGAPIAAEEVDEFWNTRHVIAQNFARSRGSSTRLDPEPRRAIDYVHASLPPSRVLEYRHRAMAIAALRDVRVVEAGIWVAPGLFSLVLLADGTNGAAGRMSEVVDACLQLVHKLGGSMEYCHGVGVRLAHLMREEHGQGLDAIRSLKAQLDPGGIMNPGKSGL